jgi:hypothetical protein
MNDTPPAIRAKEAYLQRAYDLRKEDRSPYRIQARHRVMNILAEAGWYEILEPEEGEGTAIVHISDPETHINGFIHWDGIWFTPAEDSIAIRLQHFNTTQDWLKAVQHIFDELVWEWFGRYEHIYVASLNYDRADNKFLSPIERALLGLHMTY